jgi:hypothetical protein
VPLVVLSPLSNWTKFVSVAPEVTLNSLKPSASGWAVQLTVTPWDSVSGASVWSPFPLNVLPTGEGATVTVTVEVRGLTLRAQTFAPWILVQWPGRSQIVFSAYALAPPAAARANTATASKRPLRTPVIIRAAPDAVNVGKTCQNPRVGNYSWTVREGSVDGRLIMREYVYGVPEKEPVEGQELYLSNGSGPWRVCFLEQVPEQPRSPYNILVVERVTY